jgi:hypothetical protein
MLGIRKFSTIVSFHKSIAVCIKTRRILHTTVSNLRPSLGGCVFIITDKEKTKGGRKVGGVGVMKRHEIQLKDMEVSLTLGGVGEGRVQGRGKWRV